MGRAGGYPRVAMADFDPRAYWERRLSERYTLDGVGWIGLGEAFNTWMYRVRRHVFLRTLRPLAAHAPSLRVLDVGTGTGFYVERWHELGVPAITGADLTDAAVEQLRSRFGGDSFARFDVGGDELPFAPGSFDAISCMDVLFHIVDDARFERALANLHALLAPGGILAFSDNFLHGRVMRGEHQVSRPLEEIEAALAAVGFDVVARRPMFVLFNTPLDSDSPLLRRSWSLLTKIAARGNAFGAVAGALAYPVELALVSRLHEGPSTELMVCRRAAAPAEAAAHVQRSAAG